MKTSNISYSRRSFLKATSLAGGGFLLHFSWLAGFAHTKEEIANMPEEWFELNNYIKIASNGMITLFSANPEFGSNVKTSMPMILADELNVDWEKVIVEQADFYPKRFNRQFTGGSQGIRSGWKPLRTAGATARQMLHNAAAQKWNVSVDDITSDKGVVFHKSSGKHAGFGELASLAATLPVPKDVKLKDTFSIVGTSKKNVDAKSIVTGKPLYSIDQFKKGTLIAMIIHPPAFGMRLKSFDKSSIKNLKGIKDVFAIKTLEDDYQQNFFDTTTFTELVAIVGNSTWEVMNAKKALKVEWEVAPERTFNLQGFQGPQKMTIPSGLESSSHHKAQMLEYASLAGKIERKDGDPETAFAKAAKILERTYYCPFLPHNTMEPVNCFAEVNGDKALIYGPTQAPEFIAGTIAARLKIPRENVDIKLSRMGGGFGLRAYAHHMVEAAVISQTIKAPVKLIYTREDEMTYGIYRPAYMATFRAALDEKNNLIAFHVKAGGIPETPLHANRFPAGAIDNYLAESWQINSNITIGAFRAPRSNFMGSSEQSFLDELAETMGKDPIVFRLELLERAAKNPVGKNNDYDPKRYAGVLELVRDKSGWDNSNKKGKGVAAYFCHNSYVAHVVDTKIENNQLIVDKVTTAVDCGIVINPNAAINMTEGAIVDGIGNALFGELKFNKGVPEKANFNSYRMIRQKEAPRKIEVHFVESKTDPTGLGEPPFPPVFAALANSLYKTTRIRLYDQPYIHNLKEKNIQI